MRNVKLTNIQALDELYTRNKANDTFGFMGDSCNVLMPDECPICHYGMDMVNNWRNYHDIHEDDQQSFSVFSIHSCPHCHNGFVIQHKMHIIDDVIIEQSQSTFPSNVASLKQEDKINIISPRFYTIYSQCLKAKQENLIDIYGMGYRKALETLVKDYAIYKAPENEESIKADSLHHCIEVYFNDSDAKTALMACKWLGNNETHYVNDNTDEDLLLFDDLIQDTLYYICRELRHIEAEDIIARKGRRMI